MLPPDVRTFRVPGASPPGAANEVSVEGTKPYQASSTLCVLSDADFVGSDKGKYE
ncbi:MAG: hypothetical protein K9K79_05015 [Desulfohalobiaceae bacterium]|nr:hypothetical protein [Desulfohalobiaceae bacterium]